MSKLLFCVLGFILCFLQASAQNPLPKPDNARIIILQKKLPHLKGIERIDCLNDISRECSYFDYTTHEAYYYAKQAYTEAAKINYKSGMAFSLMEIGFHMRTSPAAENHILRAISIGEFLHNDKLLGWAYLRLGSKYDKESIKTSTLWLKALHYFERAGDLEGQGLASLWLYQAYAQKGNYEEAIPYCEKALVASQKKGAQLIVWKDDLIQEALIATSKLYEEVGDYKTAMDYLIKAQKYGIDKKLHWKMEDALGKLFNKIGKHDSAFYYFKIFLAANPKSLYAKMWMGESYLASEQYEKAMELFKECEDSLMNFSWPELRLNLAYAYAGKGNFNAALTYAKKGMAKVNGAKDILGGYKLLSNIYHELGNNDSAYFYIKKYALVKDSITNKEFLWRLNNKLTSYMRAAEDQKKATVFALLQKDMILKVQQLKEQTLLKEQNEAHILLLDKDNKLIQQQLKQEALLKEQKEAKFILLDKDNKIKQQQLKQESLIKNFLLGGLFISLLAGFFIFRNLSLKRNNEKLERERMENELKLQQLENEKKHSEMLQQATELEMQALRAQMSPHFIFNCLSSINKYIIKNETEAASDYLTRFSRLIRMVLINSQKPLITLEDELDMLRLYLDMERLRFNNAFDYNISFINTIEPGAIFIPPLLLQPFCENAIWHGLMHKEGHGKLDIVIRIKHDILHCSITDNGVGRDKAAELKSKSAGNQKSLGLKITNNRLAILNQGSQEDSYYKMNDIIDEEGRIGGTRVDISIRFKDLVNDVTVKEII